MISQLRQHRSKNFQSQIFFVSKAVSSSLDDTNFVVQSFDKSQRHFVFRSTVSRNPLPMTLNHLGKFLIRSEPLPFECCLPVLKEASRPPFALVAPQLAKGLFKEVRDIESLVRAQQGLQSLAPFQSEIVAVRQQRVFLSLDKASVFARKPTVFTFSHLIERLPQMTQHMKLVVENGRLRSTRFGSLSKWFPHVHHRQANPCALGLSELIEKLPQALFRAVVTAKPDRPSLLQVAHHNAVGVSFANRYLVDADHFRSWVSRLSELRLHVLLVECFNRVPVKFKFLSDVLDRCCPTPPPYVVGKTFGVKRIVRQKLQSLALHFPPASTKHPAYLELQVHPRIAARQISNLADSAVVPTSVHLPAAATDCFFDRRTNAMTRAFGSPKTPRTMGEGRSPSKAYVSHSRLLRLIDFAMKIPCLFSSDSQEIRSLFSWGVIHFVTKIDPLDYAMSQNLFFEVVVR